MMPLMLLQWETETKEEGDRDALATFTLEADEELRK